MNNTNFDPVNDEAASFVLSSWHELFYGFTPDSYQPRLHNIPSLVEELLTVAKLLVTEPRFRGHVLKLQAELKAAIKAEDDILQGIPSYRFGCRAISNPATPDAIICGAKLLIERREEYWDHFVRLAKDSIAGLPTGKAAAHKFIRRLATFAFQNGQEDDDVWRPFVDCQNQSAEMLFERMIELTRHPNKDYSVLLATIGDQSGMNSIANFRGYEIVRRTEVQEDYRQRINACNNDTLYIQQKIHGASIRHAVTVARQNIGVDIGLVSLYKNPDGGIKIHPAALVTIDEQKVKFIQSEQAFRRLHPRRRAIDRIKEAAKLVGRSKGNDARLLAALEQLALASASSDSRTRFINLWASLETLAGAHEGESTMARVCELIVPLFVSRKVHRTTRSLTIQVEKHKRFTGLISLGCGFPSQRRVDQDRMFIAISSPKNDPKIVELFGAIKCPLLRWRIYQLWRKYHSPRNLLSQLEESKQRLEWHLSRIYRTRNLLVHEGVEAPFIAPLLDNLQNYLSTLVQRLVHELQHHPDWNIRQVVEHWHGRMNYIFESLNDTNPERLLTNNFLEEVRSPQRIWHPRFDSPLPVDRESLQHRWRSGERFEFYFFDGCKPPETGVDASCLSQWFGAGFSVEGIHYPTAEHWMMAEKARLFGDSQSLERISTDPNPATANTVGRKIEGAAQEEWNLKRFDIVYRGNVAKFEQNKELGEFLDSTAGTILVEAAEHDNIGGIGLGQNNVKAQNPAKWYGKNLLGFALTKIRERL